MINLHPWEYNEVPVLLATAFKQNAPVIALHLTRPNIDIPDRDAIGMAHYFEAAKGAYLMRDYLPGQEKGGTIIVQGTGAVSNMIKALPELDKRGLNVKIVVSSSAELFEMQDQGYKNSILSPADQLDSTVVSTSSRSLMLPWIFSKFSEEYALSPDWDNNWRSGGSLDEVLDEAHLSPGHIVDGIERFVRDRDKRLGALRKALG
ncbi:hypothetical protein [Marispirochaeta sp.]|uniref:transketolase-like TK C-terminal-containing protein n=1 Tax=Marispirochaeta sp. TaxID=2038653 RepID=UPI0029C8AA84|nr:hypothetical protein [Marispirochaeta sp.]